MSLVPVAKDGESKKAVVLSSKEVKSRNQSRTVLDEDEYLKKLDKIVQRDFFPYLKRIKAQNEYLAAVERNDVSKIRQLQMRYSSTQRRTDRIDSPTRRSPLHSDAATSSTIADKNEDAAEKASTSDIHMESRSNATSESDIEKAKKARTEGLNIDQFLNKYTSEDNASYEELSALSARRERLKNAWMYRAEQKHLALVGEQQKVGLLAADEQLALPPADRPHMLEQHTYVARNTVLFHPDAAAFTDDELFRRKKFAEREIKHANTRLPENFFAKADKDKAKAHLLQASQNRGKFDVTGTEMGGLPALVQGQMGVGGQELDNQAMPQFSYVNTPTPAPGVGESPLMTWGEIEGTPFRLDAGDVTLGTLPVFKVPEIPTRDKLAKDMADTIARRYNEKRRIAIDKATAAHSKTPRFGSTRSTTEKFLSMSPAARRLASNKLGIRLSTDKALKHSYTPSPQRSGTPKTPTPSRTGTAGSTSSGKAHITSGLLLNRARTKTPRVKDEYNESGSATQASPSLTDNLLQLGKNKKNRPTATDFFHN